MSLTLNMVGGGGGGLSATDALLRVQAPAGSTVTITKGTTTKTDLGHENADEPMYYDYYFIIHQSQFDSVNPWTVTATLGGDTASSTIVIDAADEYDMELSYNLKLYWDGVQGVPLRKGMEATYGGSAGDVTFEDTYVRLYWTTSTRWSILVTTDAVDLSDYSTLYIQLETVSKKSSNSIARFGIAPTSAAAQNFNSYTLQNDMLASMNVGETQTFSVDISSISGGYFVSAQIETWQGSGTMDVHVKRIWAER